MFSGGKEMEHRFEMDSTFLYKQSIFDPRPENCLTID